MTTCHPARTNGSVARRRSRGRGGRCGTNGSHNLIRPVLLPAHPAAAGYRLSKTRRALTSASDRWPHKLRGATGSILRPPRYANQTRRSNEFLENRDRRLRDKYLCPEVHQRCRQRCSCVGAWAGVTPVRTHLSVVGFAPAARRYCTEPSPDGGNAVRECHALLINWRWYETKSRTRSREDRPRVGERVGLVPFRRDRLQRQGEEQARNLSS